MSAHHLHESNADIYYTVRGALVARGDSLNAWCQRHEITRQWAEDVLRGRRTGPAAQKLRARFVKLLDIERYATSTPNAPPAHRFVKSS